jgi:outer membrane autotransporter protein
MGRSFIEPLATIAYVHTEVDDFNDGAATVDFSNGESLRAGAGARIGTNFSSGAGTTTELSLLGKVMNEFEDANEVTVDDGNGSSSTFSDDISGLFGDVSATATITSADGTLSGFVTAGGQFGDDFTSFNAKVGVRKGF